jgi:uncharacterized protein (DUF302 family)
MAEQDRIPDGWEEIEHEKARLLMQAHEQKRAMQKLMETSEYQILQNYLKSQFEQLTVIVMSMPSGADDVVKNTYSAGQAAGLKIALDGPSLLIEYAQSSIDSARKEEEEISDGEKYRQAAGAEGGRAGADGDEQPEFWDRFSDNGE